jgi:Ubiquitin fusion degradation protein UFD1
MKQHRSTLFFLFALIEVTIEANRNVASMPSIVSLQSSLNKGISQRWAKATRLSELEQQVEDYNADWIVRASHIGEAVKHRRLICLPLDERFDPPMGVFSHRHVQTGDKMSLPSCFWQAIQLNHADVPWLFSVRRVEGVTGERVQLKKEDEEEEEVITECQPLLELDQVVGGPLDFRAPSCYIFLPWWMMRALGLRPRDIVEVEQIETVPAGALAKLRPHSADFAKDISNPQAVLETELRHYSSLTQGSTIAFDYNKKRYWFDVVELRSAPRGVKVPMIKVQDCDIATDFLTSKDVLIEQRKKRRQKQQQEKDL